ncbi:MULTISPECIES: hypothetical protein [Mangrovimonas]|uniref:hypothetical protein n=1 Tax=Mangrovimonas TaxID=1211036 RepID=UPI0012F81F47|nr:MULTISPECIES: hypothetical protein [Mangrovimonas]
MMFALLDLGIRNTLFTELFQSIRAYISGSMEEVIIPFMLQEQSHLVFVNCKTSYSSF